MKTRLNIKIQFMDYEYFFISKIVNIAICKETQLGLEDLSLTQGLEQKLRGSRRKG